MTFDRLAEARADAEREAKSKHARAVLQKMQKVSVWTFEGVDAGEQAQRLEVSAELVAFWQGVLGWGRLKHMPRPRQLGELLDAAYG